MLNSTAKGGNASNSLHINAVGGTLVKNHAKSRFVRCKADSRIFDEDRPRMLVYGKYIDVVVLQAMIIGEGLFLCEVVALEDFSEDGGV